MLPVYTTSLIGRAAETAELIDLLHAESTSLVTLVGTSGTGKTRLSTEVAALLIQQNQHVVFVPLAAIADASLVLPALAHQLEIREQGLTSIFDQLVATLQKTPVIIILDNFEQVLAAAADVGALIKAVPTLKILVTSQVRLNVADETVYTIPGLTTPSEIPPTVEEALEFASVQLFVQRIQTVQPLFTLDRVSMPAVVEICQMLEGLPLAIEIVATHSDVLNPEDMKLLVKQHLRLYHFRNRQASGRQRIILPMIEWSLLRLAPDVQHVFNHLGVYRGSWTLDSLQAVMGEQDYNLVDALQVLVQRHLVLVYQVLEDEQRYGMLDAVQEFADSRFKRLSMEEKHTYLTQQLDFLIVLTQESRIALTTGGRSPAWMTRISHELPNIRFMLDWALVHAPDKAIKLGVAVGRYIFLAGYWKEGVAWFERILNETDSQAADQAVLMSHQVLLLKSLSMYEQAIALAEQAIPIARVANIPEALAGLLNTLGMIMLDQNKPDQSRQYLEECIEVARKQDFTTLLVAAMVNAANIDLTQQRYAEALDLYAEARTLAQQQGNRINELLCSINMGCVYLAQQQTAVAVTTLKDALSLAEELQIKELVGATLSFYAQALFLERDPETAVYIMRSIQELNELGELRLLSVSLELAAAWLLAQDNHALAGRMFGAADALREKIGAPRHDEESDPILKLLLAEDSTEFVEARQQGAQVSQEEAVAVALAQLR